MSFIKTRDSLGNPIPFMNVRIAQDHKSSDEAYDDKFTDDAGNTSFVMHLDGPHSLYANYRSKDMERFILEKYGHNEGPRWDQANQYVNDLDANEITLVLMRIDAPPVPGPITGYGTCGEWQAAVKKIFDKHGFIGAGPDNEGAGANQAPNLRATIGEIKALYTGNHANYVQWQYETVGNPPELRPRLFLPHPGGDEFERYADIGDWMTTFKWEHCK